MLRLIKWMAGGVLALILSGVLFIAIFGWNWLRGPIERITQEKTGRALAINGDLKVKLAWPRPRLQAGAVTFANPAWAKEQQMVTADAVEIGVDLSQLMQGKVYFPDVRLTRPVVFLEQSVDGRKSWLLDRNQQDEGAHANIDRLELDQGKLGYDDPANKTHVRVNLSGMSLQAGSTTGGSGVTFSAEGQFKGTPLKASGSGGSVLAIRDESTPYPLKVSATVGSTQVQADGTITGLLTLSAIDMRLALKGRSLDQLYPVLGIALPTTPPYNMEGHLLYSAKQWRYEKFSGRVGGSDIVGEAQVDTSAKRPVLTADLTSRLLDLDDLGPLIGARPGSLAQATQPADQNAPQRSRVLPDLPFKADRWHSVDAEVRLRAKTLRRAKELPLENLDTHLSLRDAVLTLDPLNFGFAGGQLNTVISLDGRKDPIQAKAQVKARKIQLAKLFPTVDLSQASIGQVNGEFNLTGQGNSVGRMLATSSGKVGLVVAGGEISQLMMEKVGLHLWEILELNLTGDRRVKLRCAVADFDVHQGIMKADALILDTAVTTLFVTGNVSLNQETLDLTINQRTKNTSPLALRSPIYVRGSFAKPEVEVDKARVATRGLGALALAMVNPLLALIPLIDAGPGRDSDCGQLIQEARALPDAGNKSGARPRK